MNSLKWNPGLLLAALTYLVFSLTGCQTTHWQQGYGQPGVPIDTAPVPESDLGTGTDSLMLDESNSSNTLSTPDSTELARTPNRPSPRSRSNFRAPTGGRMIVLGEPGQKPLSQYFEEDFQTEVGSVQKLPVTKAPDQPTKPKSDVVRKSPQNDLPELRLDDLEEFRSSTINTPDPGDVTGPELPLFTETPATNLVPTMTVDVPDNIPVGNSSQVTVTVSGIPPELANLFRLKVNLPDALRHPDKSTPEFELQILTPERDLKSAVSFPLLATKSGTHSFEVSLRKGGEEIAWKKISVVAKSGLLAVSLTGPQSKPLGANAEYTLKLHNQSQKSLGPITAVIEFDGTLIPREASEGAEQKAGRLEWQFPVLHPEEQIFLQVEFECPVESAHACITARVQAGDRPTLQEQSCLKIFRPNGSIRVEVEDHNDLARPGQELTAIVRITNLGLVTARDVTLSLDLPDTLKFKSHTTTLGNNKTNVPLADQLIQLLFEPVAEIKPDQTLEFQITFEPVKSGEGIFQARVIDQVHTEPLKAAEPFTVTP